MPEPIFDQKTFPSLFGRVHSKFKGFLVGVFNFTAFSIEMSVSKQCRP